MATKQKFPKVLYVYFDEPSDNLDPVLLAAQELSDCGVHNEHVSVARYTLEAVGEAVNTTRWEPCTKPKAGKAR